MQGEATQGLEPAALWHYFAELCKVPRESKRERGAGDLVIGVAKSLGLVHARDSAGNVVVRVPASKGRERNPSLCLQCHLDMVCVKSPDTVHDFARDAITLVRAGEFMTADGTTLGADNGIAVAANLAIMADHDIEHGRLELLFTVDEETGLTGARRLEPGFLVSRTLINLDSEEEGVLCVGCAGGRDTVGTWPLTFDPTPAGFQAIEVKVSGLQGGHSGTDIHRGRGNAIKIINRLLFELDHLGGRVVRLEGGSKRNAIPAEATAVVCTPKARVGQALAAVESMGKVLQTELGPLEPGFECSASPQRSRSSRVLKRGLQRRLLRVLSGLPHGVVKMSTSIADLVETSTNLALIRQGARELSFSTSQRSLVASELDEVVGTVSAIFELGGATVSGSEPYPGWEPKFDSPILKAAIHTYRQMYGHEPSVKAIHAGLECGVIGEKFPGIDMVSLGPTILDAHSPQERVHSPSVSRFWEFLLAILKSAN